MVVVIIIIAILFCIIARPLKWAALEEEGLQSFATAASRFHCHRLFSSRRPPLRFARLLSWRPFVVLSLHAGGGGGPPTRSLAATLREHANDSAGPRLSGR
jgi:hypothetical protein